MDFLESGKQILDDFHVPSIPGMGMLRDKGVVGTFQAGLDALKQRTGEAVNAVGDFGGKILYGNHPPAPTPVAPKPVAPAPVAAKPMGMNRVDLGEGNSITAGHPIQPEVAQRMQAAAVPSTQAQLDHRAESAALADQRYADLHARQAQQTPQQAPQAVGGMNRPDYSEVIAQAIGVMNSDRPSGSFDRQLDHKHKVQAASDVLKAVGGMQTAGNEQASHENIASMNNATDQQRLAAASDEARQRSALGMGQLASQDQYRRDQASNAASKLAMEKQLAEAEAAKLLAARQAYADQLKRQGTGMFFDDQDMLDNAELVGAGSVSPSEMYKQLNK